MCTATTLNTLYIDASWTYDSIIFLVNCSINLVLEIRVKANSSTYWPSSSTHTMKRTKNIWQFLTSTKRATPPPHPMNSSCTSLIIMVSIERSTNGSQCFLRRCIALTPCGMRIDKLSVRSITRSSTSPTTLLVWHQRLTLWYQIGDCDTIPILLSTI